jgi:general secretion pathway protein I
MTRRPAETLLRAARPASGFTLIEVLAALVIVALGMLGVIEAVSQEARNGAYLREKTIAHWIAMNVVTAQRLQPSPPEVADSSDELEFAGQRWRWTMHVSQTQVQSLRRMDVTVRPADAKDDVALASVTGFYGSAVGAAGGGTLAWYGTGGAPGPGDDESGNGAGNTDAGQKNPPEQPVQEVLPPTDPMDKEE